MRSALLSLALWDTGLLPSPSCPDRGRLSSFMHRKALGSRRHPALNGLGVNEGEALEERRLAPIRSPAQRSEFPHSLLLLASGDTVQQRGRAMPPCLPGPHPSTSRSLLRTQPYPQGPLFPRDSPLPGILSPSSQSSLLLAL